ncbi:MAG: TatD family hydrolase [Elusimicrobiaceae bacterium]|nr:TatD family hydrolase [Elusimicrobiaceae bacterium]
MNIRYCDSHAHLCDRAFETDRDTVIARARACGTDLIFETPCVPDDWAPALELCARYPGKIYAVCGIHPQDCEQATPENLARLTELLRLPQVRGLGEIGLDYARCNQSFEEQAAALGKILRHTAGSRKPVVLHCRNPFDGSGKRNAYQEMFSVMRACWTPHFNGRFSGILHCFCGDGPDLRAALDMGLAIGVNGTISYPKNGMLRELIKSAGLNNIVLETDCPYLPPQSGRGKRNEPSKIPEICAHAAALLGVTPEQAAEATLANALEIFAPGG